jgi:hypothetical protein
VLEVYGAYALAKFICQSHCVALEFIAREDREMSNRGNWIQAAAVICCFANGGARAGLANRTAASIPEVYSLISDNDGKVRLIADATAPGVPTTAEVVTIEKSIAILNTLCHVADPIISPEPPPGRVQGVVQGLKAEDVQQWLKNVPSGAKDIASSCKRPAPDPAATAAVSGVIIGPGDPGGRVEGVIKNLSTLDMSEFSK